MSRDLASEIITLGLIELRARVGASPVSSGVSAPVGSVLQNLESATTPPKTWVKWSSAGPQPDLQWRDELMRGPYYNVKDYGAVGNGVTDDTTAINNAINAAVAAGGGVIFFPHGTYAVSKNGATLASFDLRGKSNLGFMGEGCSSRISMQGSAGGGDWYIFRVGNSGATPSRRIFFYRMSTDALGLTSPDPAEQNHHISIQNGTALAVSQIDICDWWFFFSVGDGVRQAANNGDPIQDVSIRRCVFNMRNPNTLQGCRAAVTWNSAIAQMWMTDCWGTGSDDNLFDTEATQSSDLSPLGYWKLLRTHAESDAPTVDLAWTCGGHSGDANGLSVGVIFSMNSISHGALQFGQIDRAIIAGNNIDYTGYPANTTAAITGTQAQTRMLITQNICVREPDITIPGSGINLAAATGFSPDHLVFRGNIILNLTNASASPVLNVESATDVIAEDNICLRQPSNTNTAFGIEYRAIARAGARFTARRNLCGIYAGVNNLLTGVIMADDNAMSDIIVQENIVKNAASGIRFTRTVNFGARLAGDNVLSTTADSVEWSTDVTQKFGPHGGMAQSGVAACFGTSLWSITVGSPEGAVNANIGDICQRRDGGAGTTLYVKESNNGGNTGWVAK